MQTATCKHATHRLPVHPPTGQASTCRRDGYPFAVDAYIRPSEARKLAAALAELADYADGVW